MVLINRAKEYGQLSGVVLHLVDGGLLILQYVDDTILFMEHDLEQAWNMKIILYAFETVSSLKINLHKSEVYCFGEAWEVADQYTQLFGYKPRDLPMTYLGTPIHFRKLRNKD